MTDDVKIKVIPSTDPRLGRHVEHDPRSRSFAFTAPAKVELRSVRHERFIPVLDQGNVGSCTGNSGVGAAGSHPFYSTLKDKVNDWSEAAAVQLYSDATAIDSWPGTYPPEDTGSSGLAVAKVLKNRGWISGYRHTFTFDDLCAALQEGPVLLGINWYNNFFYPSYGEIKIGENDTVAGGHEICLDEIDMERQRFGFTNSWGTVWGDNGRGYISFELMKRLLSEDGDVVVLVPNTEPAPQPQPTPSDPVVDPTVDVVDETVWNAVKEWAYARHSGSNRKAANAVKDWAAKKGLTK